MKMNMIISKKHIVLSALVLALSVAVYLNWEYVKTNGDTFENTSKVAVDGAVEETAGTGGGRMARPGKPPLTGRPTSRRRSSPAPRPGMRRRTP